MALQHDHHSFFANTWMGGVWAAWLHEAILVGGFMDTYHTVHELHHGCLIFYLMLMSLLNLHVFQQRPMMGWWLVYQGVLFDWVKVRGC